MNKKELFVRYLLFIAGLFFTGLGVAFTKHGNLGVSPISSVANVMSLRFTFLTMGNWLIVWNCVLIVMQIVILRKDFKLYQFLQIPLSFLFGIFTDIGMALVSAIPAESYASRLLMLFIGIVIVAFGVSLAVTADVIMNSGEAVVKAISDKTGKEFGSVKVCFDVFCVVSAVILSLILFGGTVEGTREGTIVSAVATGFVVKLILKYMRPAFDGAIEKIK